MNMLEDDLHKLWKLHNEEFKLEKLPLEAHLLLLQLKILNHYFMSEFFFPPILNNPLFHI